MDQKALLGMAKTVRLFPDESAAIRQLVLQYAHARPLSPPGRTPEGWFPFAPAPTVFEVLRSFVSPLRPMPVLSIIVAGCLAFGTSLNVAAQSALPDEFLYQVKLHLNESVAGALHTSPASRAQFETDRLEKRLEEAAALVAAGRLQGGVTSDVSGNIHAQLERVQLAAGALAESGDATAALEVHSQVESSLIANAAVLGSLAQRKHVAAADVQDLLRDVEKAEYKAVQARVRTEKKVSAETASAFSVRTGAEGSFASALNKIEEVHRFIGKTGPSSDAQVLAQANARFALAKKLLGSARAKLDADQFGDAFSLSRTAIRTAQEAKIMLKVSSTLPQRKVEAEAKVDARL